MGIIIASENLVGVLFVGSYKLQALLGNIAQYD